MTKDSNAADAARLAFLLNELRLPAIKLLWPDIAAQAEKQGWPAARFLAAFAEHELAQRAMRRTERHLIEARLLTAWQAPARRSRMSYQPTGSASERSPAPAGCASRAMTKRSVVSRDRRSSAGIITTWPATSWPISFLSWATWLLRSWASVEKRGYAICADLLR
jgi:hypothetical protein